MGQTAIIGGGLSGLACAQTLVTHGHDVVVFDRGRGVGGRMATRGSSTDASLPFDHGAPFFEVGDTTFRDIVASWVDAGFCAPWRPTWGRVSGQDIVERQARSVYVGMPSMREICHQLSSGCDIRPGAVVVGLERSASGWALGLEDGSTSDVFDAVVFAAAARQTERVLGERFPEITSALGRITMAPHWVCMAASDAPPRSMPDVIETPEDAVLQLIVRDDAKPGRAEGARWVAHASQEWSGARLEVSREEMAIELGVALRRCLALDGAWSHCRAHRWSLARVVQPIDAPYVLEERLGVCGDGFGGSGVEAAYLSGRSMAMQLLSM
ncbi:MAG: NAD(P)-binding protein [Planctomycetota bacterium]